MKNKAIRELSTLCTSGYRQS